MKKWLILILFLVPYHIQAKPEIIVSEDSSVYWNCPFRMLVYTSPLAIVHINGKLGYSIHPHGSIDYLPNYDLYNKFLYQYDPGLQLYLSKLSYCGYGNHGHNDKEYYMAAQEMIWEQFVDVDVTWSHNRADTMTSIDIESYKNDILACVVEYEEVPSLPTEIKGKLGQIYSYKDETELLHYYEIVSTHDNEVWIEEDTLYIRLLSDHEETLQLNRKIDGEGMQLYIGGYGHQRLATFDINEERPLSIPIAVPENPVGTLSLTILNEYNEPYTGSVLIFGNNQQEMTYQIENGLLITDLVYGNYTVEIPSSGLVQKEMTINIDSDIQEVNFMLEEKKNKLSVQVWEEILKENDGVISYEKVRSSHSVTLIANEDIMDIYGNIRYRAGEIIESEGNLWYLLSGEYLLDGQKINVNEDITLERNILYPKSNISITGLSNEVTYQIINQSEIDEIPIGQVILEGTIQEDLTVALPHGKYLLKMGTQEFLFQITEEQHVFTFPYQSVVIEEEPVADRIEKPGNIIKEEVITLPNTNSDFYRYVIFGLLLFSCLCIL